MAEKAVPEKKVKNDAQKREEELLRHSEIRNGRFIRYYGKQEEIVIPEAALNAPLTVNADDAA